MHIQLNDEPVTLPSAMSVEEMLQYLKHHQPGTALAINQQIIPRSDWATRTVQPGDNILLFQAIAGG